MWKVYLEIGLCIWDPTIVIIKQTKLHLVLVLSIPMRLTALGQVSVVSLIKIAAPFSWLHRCLTREGDGPDSAILREEQ